MPAPLAIPLIAAGVSAAASLYQTVSGISQKAKARNMAREYKRQSLSNVYKNLGMSTAAEEAASERISRNVATQTEALSKLGSRGVGRIGAVAQQSQEAQTQVSASLDQKKRELDRLIAGDEIRIQQTEEQRDRDNIAGMGQLGYVGSQNIASGVGNIADSAGQFARLFSDKGAVTDAGGGNSSIANISSTYDVNEIYND